MMARYRILKKNRRKKYRRHPGEYLNHLSEWSAHQYSPGHWTGGNIPPWIRYGGRPAGILFLCGGIAWLGFALADLADNFAPGKIPANAFGLAVGVVLTLAGVAKLRTKKRSSFNDQKWRLINWPGMKP